MRITIRTIEITSETLRVSEDVSISEMAGNIQATEGTETGDMM